MVLNEVVPVVNEVIQYSNIDQPDNIENRFGELDWFVVDTEQNQNSENQHAEHTDKDDQILNFEHLQMPIIPKIEFATELSTHMLNLK